MKKILVLCLSILVNTFGCHSETNVLPANTWSNGCMQLAPELEGYRLTGVCCEYVQMPKVALRGNNTFSVEGSYHSFTGAGFSNTPVQLTGYLSSDGNTLRIDYTINAHPVSYTLKLGPATASCTCGCD